MPSLRTVKLHNEMMAIDPKPRPDLLEPWIELLRCFNSDWEIDWAAGSMHNKDKHLWVTFKGVDGKVDIDKGTVENIKTSNSDLLEASP